MKIKILAFGITKDIIGAPQLVLDLEKPLTVDQLKTELGKQYPRFNELKSFAIAVNQEYATPEQVVYAEDELVLIPPVSGG